MARRHIDILYTGGTIGMTMGPHGFEPAQGLLAKSLARSPRFHAGHPSDPPEHGLILPTDHGEDEVRYAIHEYSPLLDSSNMGVDDWVRLGQDIYARHEKSDAFIILHGTDTMAYTASALSFMLEGLQKPVILTGSQIPLCRVRNDAQDNLLGALTLAARPDIPEVGVYFHNHLYRGNRTKKVDADGLNAFTSGNLRPLARVGIEVEVDHSVVRPMPSQPLKLKPITSRHVIGVRWFPGLTASVLERLLQPPLQGIVLETYGAGNVPHRRPELLRILRRAYDQGIVLAHVTQCLRGHVHPTYAAGRALADCGVLGGEDMTAECALVKLAWLLSQPDLDRETIAERFTSDMRGELSKRMV